MQKIKKRVTIISFLIVILVSNSFLSMAQQAKEVIALPQNNKLYIDATTGRNSNSGEQDSPLQTLNEAANRINAAKGTGAITIYLSKGLYILSETAAFNPLNWEFTKENRLTIRAEVLPGESNWSPADMPILLSSMPFSVEKNDKGEPTGGQNFGIMIQNSHVSILGLRVMGEPVHENPSKGILIRNYPIIWEGKGLEDLHVSQCLFIGNKYAIPNHLAILSNGKNLEVDHCLFYGIKDAVVMWNSPATNSSFHHNIIADTYGAVVWTWSAAEDFKFYNNVVSNANVLWVLNKDGKLSYSINNSVIVGYNDFVNKGGGPQGFGEKANPAKLKLGKDVVLKSKGKLEIIEDQTNKLFLHIKPGTLGANLGAGLFLK
ncbi:MAG: hypothetical protein JST02_00805 [Bacteroidetes bacterium]|nr:hypothetical protein [Bacteroidota bacterium]